MDYQSVSAILIKSLDLASPPVALAFVDAATGKASAGEAAPAPSSCSFWRNAEAGLFFAPAASHGGCPVGAMVMGFELSNALKEELGGLVSEMVNRNYLVSDEPPAYRSTPALRKEFYMVRLQGSRLRRMSLSAGLRLPKP